MRYLYLIIGVFVFIVLLVFIIFGIHQPVATNKSKPVIMSDFADTDTSVVYTAEGITNGDESHHSIIITVNQDSRTVEVISGYQDAVIESQSFANNSSAFKEFLAGLQIEGFITKRNHPSVTDIEGQCPLGVKYRFDSTDITGAPSDLWITSCSSKIGTFGGSLSGVQQMFQLQIPNYNKIVSGVDLQ